MEKYQTAPDQEEEITITDDRAEYSVLKGFLIVVAVDLLIAYAIYQLL